MGPSPSCAFSGRVCSLLSPDKARSPATPGMILALPSAPSPQTGSAAAPAPRGNRRLLIGASLAVVVLAMLA